MIMIRRGSINAALVERWQGKGRYKGYIRYEKLDDYCGLGGVRSRTMY